MVCGALASDTASAGCDSLCPGVAGALAFLCHPACEA